MNFSNDKKSDRVTSFDKKKFDDNYTPNVEQGNQRFEWADEPLKDNLNFGTEPGRTQVREEQRRNIFSTQDTNQNKGDKPKGVKQENIFSRKDEKKQDVKQDVKQGQKTGNVFSSEEVTNDKKDFGNKSSESKGQKGNKKYDNKDKRKEFKEDKTLVKQDQLEKVEVMLKTILDKVELSESKILYSINNQVIKTDLKNEFEKKFVSKELFDEMVSQKEKEIQELEKFVNTLIKKVDHLSEIVARQDNIKKEDKEKDDSNN